MSWQLLLIAGVSWRSIFKDFSIQHYTDWLNISFLQAIILDLWAETSLPRIYVSSSLCTAFLCLPASSPHFTHFVLCEIELNRCVVLWNVSESRKVLFPHHSLLWCYCRTLSTTVSWALPKALTLADMHWKRTWKVLAPWEIKKKDSYPLQIIRLCNRMWLFLNAIFVFRWVHEVPRASGNSDPFL